LIESRNYEGKTILYLSVEHERTEIALYLMDTYHSIDMEKKDTKDGNNALHVACMKRNYNVAERIFRDRPKLCLS
jgi:ankyrin repeat protein